MKPLLRLSLTGALGCLAVSTHAQVTLDPGGYTQSFDGLGAGLPVGWSVRTGATANAPGSSAVFDGTSYAWSGTGGGFHNYASTDGLGAASTAAQQAAAADRALGVRPTASSGDPGAAFVLQVMDTLGYQDFAVSFSFHLVDEEGRQNSWALDYALGTNPSTFTSLHSFARDSWGSQLETVALPAGAGNQSEPLWIRLVVLNPSTGTGSRDSVAVDDFRLEYRPLTAVPEPQTWALGAGLGLLGFAAWRRARAHRS
jgi:hypothetical protein